MLPLIRYVSWASHSFPKPYLSNKRLRQDSSSFPVLKVIIYNDSPSWSTVEIKLIPQVSGLL